MLLWTNRREPIVRSLTSPPVNAARVVTLLCFAEEARIMAEAHLDAPGSVQPANITRYTECLISPPEYPHLGLGQDGHRGIVVSVLGPRGVWPVAPIQVWTGDGHIFRQRLTRYSLTSAALKIAMRLEPEDQLPALLPGLNAIPVPDLTIVINLKQTPG